MDTAELYRTLLMRTPGPKPETLVRSAAAYLHGLDRLPGGGSGAHLLRDLASAATTPADVLAGFAASDDASVRRELILNPALSDPVRQQMLRAERTPLVFAKLAERSNDPATLGYIAGRTITGPHKLTVWANLLNNPALPADAAVGLVLRTQDALWGPDAAEFDELADAARGAFTVWPGLAARVAAKLVWPSLIVAAGRSGELDAEGWAHVERQLVDALLATVAAGEPVPWPYASAFDDLMTDGRTPRALRERIARLIIDRGRAHSDLVLRARRVLAGPDGDTRGDVDALVAAASGDDAEALRMLAARPKLPTEVVGRLLRNPHTPVEVALELAPRMRHLGPELADVFAVHTAADVAGQLCWRIGPDALDAVPADRWLNTVAATLTHVCGGLRQGYSMSHVRPRWEPFVDALDPATLERLPWPLVRDLAREFSTVTAWVTGQLTRVLAEPGAGRIFAATEEAYSGPAGDLIAALAGAASPVVESAPLAS